MCDSSRKKGRGIVRTFKCQVTQDPNDSSNEQISPVELIAHLKKRVTHAEMWECPLENLNGVLQTLGMVHQGIVLTMEDGKKYLVHKMPSDGNKGNGDAVVSKAENMGKNWSLVKEKDVYTAKLDEYLEKCGDRYNITTDNCLHAVTRMWSLE